MLTIRALHGGRADCAAATRRLEVAGFRVVGVVVEGPHLSATLDDELGDPARESAALEALTAIEEVVTHADLAEIMRTLARIESKLDGETRP